MVRYRFVIRPLRITVFDNRFAAVKNIGERLLRFLYIKGLLGERATVLPVRQFNVKIAAIGSQGSVCRVYDC